MPTRKELARQVERDRALLAKLEAGVKDIKRHLEWEEAELARMDREGTNEVLTPELTRVKVNKPVTNEHRMNIARGQKGGDAEFASMLAASGFTQKRLAKQLKITPALLSMYRNGKRPIPQERADKVQELTGWKATAKNWPGDIVS